MFRTASLVLLLTSILAAFCVATTATATTSADDDQTLLTVTGSINKTNRGPFDGFKDGFFAHYDRSFAMAFEFGAEALDALPQKRIIADAATPTWPGPLKMEGPLLKDVLAAAGAADKTIMLYALDGYGVEMTPKDISSRDWILARKVNGLPLAIGGRGPLWLTYDTADSKADEKAEAAWIWSVFHIEAK